MEVKINQRQKKSRCQRPILTVLSKSNAIDKFKSNWTTAKNTAPHIFVYLFYLLLSDCVYTHECDTGRAVL